MLKRIPQKKDAIERTAVESRAGETRASGLPERNKKRIEQVACSRRLPFGTVISSGEQKEDRAGLLGSTCGEKKNNLGLPGSTCGEKKNNLGK
ncbi:hypothetical protein NDU88_003504 [Pleurodeles waltl]|uniref:Uncharacterized protein n=1 Tax=Pleurodeles waltl TaxID=8319 RepID=A0AAV7L662_PLEWA|nr:hypothetical protein NDU88_003504 [Pleurodeles waltl]